MKYLFLTVMILAFWSCQSDPKPKTHSTPDHYYSALYFRYIADVHEFLLEFVPTKGPTADNAKPFAFEDGVFFNGGTMEEIQPKSNLPLKYTVQRQDEFPQNIEIKIKDILEYSTPTPILKHFSARKEGTNITINTTTPIANKDQLIMVFTGSQGKSYTKTIPGPIKLPYTFNIEGQGLTEPISLAPMYQKRNTYQHNDITVNILLEYYATETTFD